MSWVLVKVSLLEGFDVSKCKLCVISIGRAAAAGAMLTVNRKTLTDLHTYAWIKRTHLRSFCF